MKTKIKQVLIKIHLETKNKLDMGMKKLSNELGFKLSYNDYISYMLKNEVVVIPKLVTVPNLKQANKLFQRMQGNINKLRKLR